MTDDMIQVRKTPDIKLKDKEGRYQIRLNLKKAFGFVPEEIIVRKVPGRTNCVFVAAVLTEEMIKKEKKLKVTSLKKS